MATNMDNKLATFSRGSEEDFNLRCLPCHRDHTTRPAHGYCMDCQEHLCHECYKNHKKPAPCHHHTLQNKETMPSTQTLTDAPVHAGTTDHMTTPCPQHKKEIIKLFCRDHDVLLCSICLALKHNKSCHVDYIPDVSHKMINSQDYNHIMDRMDIMLKKCTAIKKKTSTDANKSTNSLKDALQEIKMYKKEINKRIDELQKEIEANIQSLQHENDEKMKTVETICEDVKKTVSVTYDSIKQLNTSKQADQLFMKVKQAQKQLQEFEQSITSLSTDNSIEEYKFIPNQAINEVLQKENMIGDISTKHQTRTGSSSQSNVLPSSASVLLPSADDTNTPTCLGEICVKTSKDKERCWITGMTVLPPDRLVLADYSNKSIKLVDVNSKSIISQLSLGTGYTDRPWDITSTTSSQVAVTVPYRQYIQFISVSDKLRKAHTIQTDDYCWCICCHQDKLVVTYWNPGKLEIMDMSGRVITRVTTDSTGTDIFTNPRYVQANSRSIYVTDIQTNKVIMLNWNGEITGRITDIGDPRGLAPLPDGSLLVCDWEAHDIVYHVAGDGTNSRAVIHVRCPCAVCVDDGGQKLYISRLTGEDKPDNNILIYNI